MVRSAFSSCGAFVVAGSEDGNAYAWNADTGQLQRTYTDTGYSRAVNAVEFHPHDNMVAFASFQPNQPVLIYEYDIARAEKERNALEKASLSPGASESTKRVLAEKQIFEVSRPEPSRELCRASRGV